MAVLQQEGLSPGFLRETIYVIVLLSELWFGNQQCWRVWRASWKVCIHFSRFISGGGPCLKHSATLVGGGIWNCLHGRLSHLSMTMSSASALQFGCIRADETADFWRGNINHSKYRLQSQNPSASCKNYYMEDAFFTPDAVRCYDTWRIFYSRHTCAWGLPLSVFFSMPDLMSTSNKGAWFPSLKKAGLALSAQSNDSKYEDLRGFHL